MHEVTWVSLISCLTLILMCTFNMNVTLPAFLILIQCETYGTTALDALYTELLQPPTKLGIIGSGCSLATEPTAQISHYYNITHVRSVVLFIGLGCRCACILAQPQSSFRGGNTQ